jgi:hypothetical protein
MANVNIGNIKPPKAPNLPIPPNEYSQQYGNILTNALRLYFNQIDLLCKYLITSSIGYFLDMPYGAFSDSTLHTASVINTGYALTFDTTNFSDGTPFFQRQPDLYIEPTDASVIVTLFPSIYNIQYTLQVENTVGTAGFLYVWASTDGVDVPNSTTKIAVPASITNLAFTGSNIVETVASGSFIQLKWAVTNVGIKIAPNAATAFCTAAPSIKLTVSSVSA